MKSKFLNLKEFVLVLLLACLETVIGLVAAMPFAANLQLVYFLVPGLTGLINGIIYVLLIKKCPKVGTQFINADKELPLCRKRLFVESAAFRHFKLSY